MADTEDPEPQFNSLAERIAALNKQKSFHANGAAASNPNAPRKRPPPPAPPGPPGRPIGGPPRDAVPADGAEPVKSPPTRPVVPSRPSKPAPPPLPSRTPSNQASPAMPPRRVSTQSGHLHVRRGSASSDVSQLSAVSSLSLGPSPSPAATPGGGGPRHKMAPAFGTTVLPKLPPSRREVEAQTQSQETHTVDAAPKRPPIPPSSASQTSLDSAATDPQPSSQQPQVPARPGLPPRLPSRPVKSPAPPVRAPQQVPAHLKKPILGFDNKPAPKPSEPAATPPPQPRRPSNSQHQGHDDAPPPIPLASKPTIDQVQQSSPRPAVAPPAASNECWTCRDWSGPDNLAAQFPRDSLPRQDVVGYLARALCDPFPLYTDKARAIFTWFHHNIFYDTVAFFGNNVKHMTVEDTIFSGRAVCQGYAETYKAIANRAGLDCVVVAGHGKGFGYTALKPGEPVPRADPSGHAWNAVRVDGGHWNLLDACWGAGHLCSETNLYKQKFAPHQFTASNEVFGQRHFPKNPEHQFREDGRVISWDEYYIGRHVGPTPVFYTNGHQEGIAEDSVQPVGRHISVGSGEVVRFQFSKICPHWTSEKHGLGRPPLLLLSIHGVDGRKDDMVPIETNGEWHWVDVHARDLGAPGQAVQVAILTKIDGRDGRGVTASEFLSKRGKVGMAWSYILKWELVG